MRLLAESGDENHQIEMKRDGEKVVASIDGRVYDLEVSEPEPNLFLIKNQGKIFEVYVPPGVGENGTKQISVGGKDFDIRLIDPKRLRSSGGGDAHSGGLAEIKTAMPGKVVRILLESGAVVAKGDAVLVVEAMKMQNELKSPKDGILKEIRVEEGATVSAGDILATVE